MNIQVSKKPSREEIEKVAQTLVIHVNGNEGADPYALIRETGLSPNLQETLLKKFNIHNFLHDFHAASDDPHNRDVGCPPLSVDKLFEGATSPTEEGNAAQVTRAEGPGVEGVSVKKKIVIPMSQAQDMQDMTKNPIGKPPAPPQKKEEEPKEETKEASSNPLAAYDNDSTAHLEAAISQLDDNIYFAAHRYRGDIMKLASAIGANSSFEDELVRCHIDSPVTAHIFKAAGQDVPSPTKTARWVIQEDEKVAALVTALEDDLQELGLQQEQRELLQRVVAARNGE